MDLSGAPDAICAAVAFLEGRGLSWRKATFLTTTDQQGILGGQSDLVVVITADRGQWSLLVGDTEVQFDMDVWHSVLDDTHMEPNGRPLGEQVAYLRANFPKIETSLFGSRTTGLLRTARLERARLVFGPEFL
ncbi:hypothetical protein [Subtercola boreus]|uniref:hypothetical protein n=1 Tax=Subtercola boreus TaxID=120213 RepID=UPI001170BB91|nr:hypothetical protein [Subtercola boreus]TQL53953.1 hypothetical protein FB464_1474 [Subtercola boreus]